MLDNLAKIASTSDITQSVHIFLSMPLTATDRINRVITLARLWRAKNVTRVELDANEPVVDQLRALLRDTNRANKLFNQLKLWDTDGDGRVSRKEFRQGIKKTLVTDPVPKTYIDALFNRLLDSVGVSGGEIKFDALKTALKRLSDETETTPAAKTTKRQHSAMVGASPARIMPKGPAVALLPPMSPSKLSPELKRAVTRNTIASLAALPASPLRPAMMRVAALGPLSPLSRGRPAGPLSSKSKANLGKWSQIALEQMQDTTASWM